MTRDEVQARIQKALIDLFELSPDDVVPTARFVEDLGLDSIDAIDMAVEIQQLTGQRVGDSALRKLVVVDDAVALVYGLMQKAETEQTTGASPSSPAEDGPANE